MKPGPWCQSSAPAEPPGPGPGCICSVPFLTGHRPPEGLNSSAGKCLASAQGPPGQESRHKHCLAAHLAVTFLSKQAPGPFINQPSPHALRFSLAPALMPSSPQAQGGAWAQECELHSAAGGTRPLARSLRSLALRSGHSLLPGGCEGSVTEQRRPARAQPCMNQELFRLHRAFPPDSGGFATLTHAGPGKRARGIFR